MVRPACRAVITAVLALLIFALISGFGAALASGSGGYTWVTQNPVGTGGETIYATSALSATAVWSVGAYGTILYWNGTTLAKQASGTTNNLYGVYAQNATHVWAVGEKGTILFSNNGTTWAPQGTGVTTYDLLSVTAPANNRVWAVGGYDGFKNAVILYSTGTTWTVQLNQATGGFTDVYAFNTTNVWAVGIWTWYYNGTTWTKVNDGNSATGIDPYRISGYSATNLWAIGWSGRVLRSTNAGTTWTDANVPDRNSPVSISSLDATHIWVVGWGGVIQFYNNTAWSTQASGTTKDLFKVDAFNTTGIFAAGDGIFLSYATPTWNSRSGGTTSQLNAVSGRDASNLWTVGTNVATFGNIQSTTNGGAIWGTRASGTTNTLNAVDIFDSTHTWVAGQNLVNFWNGSAWTTQINGAANTVSATVAAGTQPRSLAVNSTTNKIYVANAGTNNVSVMDGSTDTVTKTINVGTNPRGVCVNSTTNKIYVANNGSNNVSVIDGSTDAVSTTVGVGTTPYRLCVNPATNKIYVANYGSNNVSVINGATNTVIATPTVGSGPIATCANSTTNKIYVANYTDGTVSVINGATDTVSPTPVTVGSQPYGLEANSTTNKIYVPNNNSSSVSIINGSTDTVSKTLTVGTNPRGVDANSTTNMIYVANFGSNNISVVDGSTDTVSTTLTVGTGPFDAGVNSSTTKIYVTNYTSNNVSVINGKDRMFYCIAAAAANRVWAGVDDGWIRYYNGTAWVIQNPDSAFTGAYYGIAAPDATHVWAVGASGEIAYRNGTSWAKQTSNTTNTLRAVTALNASTAWAVGDAGTIRYTSNAGATWQTQASGTTQNLLGVSAADATHVWAVGAGGTILFYDGTSWAPQDSPTTNNLRAVFAYDANDAWAVGDNGTIIFADPPYIKACAPGWANPGDTVDVEIIGAYTHFQASTPTLSFGAGVSVVPGSVNVVDNTHILAQVQVDPGAVLGPREVSASTTGETPIPLAGGFVVGATPTIASISKASAPRGWTGDVEIAGSQTGFSPASQAAFGSGVTVNDVTFRDIYTVTANITVDASAAPGPRSVNVSTGGETPAPLADGFTVATPPSVTDVSPGAGPTGSEVTVTGSGFGSSQGTSTVTFNGTSATVTTDHWTDGVITTTVPSGVRTGPVVVSTTAGGISNTDKVFTVPAPTISSCSPTSARRGDTINVDITGTNTNFLGGSSQTTFSNSGIKVNSMAVTDTTHAAANITVAADAAPGPRDMNVITGAETPAPLAGGFTIPAPPLVASVSPVYGGPGTAVTVKGSGFGASAGSGTNRSEVLFGGVPAGSTSWSDTRITCTVPEGARSGAVTVSSQNGTSNADRLFSVTSPKWYLPEGSTAWGFNTDIAIVNPNSQQVTVRVTYLTRDGLVHRPDIPMAPMSRTTINPVDQDNLLNTDFSTKVECLEGKSIAADRTMFWRGPGADAAEGHSSIGVTQPATTWYLAEGSSAWNFECWLLIMNPSATQADCTVTYMIEGQGPVSVRKTVPAHSRASYNMRDDIGQADASIRVTSDVPVIPERAMYRNNRREGHDSIGVAAPSNDFFLAEGSTAWGFTTYVLVENPNPDPAQVTVTYMTPSGEVKQPAFTLAGLSRKTIKVNDAAPGLDLSTHVHGSRPLVAERSMYWDNGTGEACHDSIGAAAPQPTWYLADGRSGYGFERTFETWTLVQNPNPGPVDITVTYLTYNGAANQTFTDTIPGNSRRSYNMGDKIKDNSAGAVVQSKTPGGNIIVERSMYWDSRSGGTNTIGEH